MCKEDKDEIYRTLAKNNPWYKLAVDSIKKDDKKDKPNGYHWFLSLYMISKKSKIFSDVDFINIQKTVPKNHWLKEIDIATAVKESNIKSLALIKRIKPELEKHSDGIYFLKLHFKESIDFSNFIFPIYVCFEGSKFSGNVSFENAIFKNYANFKISRFKRRASFQGAVFELHAPRFYGAKFNNEMTFSDIVPPKLGMDDDDRVDKKNKELSDEKANEKYRKRIGENQNSYENLVAKLYRQKKYHDQHFFFRQEMRCRRTLGGNFNRLIYGLYERFADYGYGVGRAIFYWFAHIFIFAVVLCLIRAYDCFNFSVANISLCKYLFNIFLDNFGCSLGISLSNSHILFFKGDRLKECYETFETTTWFNAIWGIQTITGTLFIFLVLLTLRVRFRLK